MIMILEQFPQHPLKIHMNEAELVVPLGQQNEPLPRHAVKGSLLD